MTRAEQNISMSEVYAEYDVFAKSNIQDTTTIAVPTVYQAQRRGKWFEVHKLEYDAIDTTSNLDLVADPRNQESVAYMRSVNCLTLPWP
jgi:hypothetical protein